ncbi:hypothetical protein KQI82_06380 [Oscillibacter sp. MSJ-2]|uniref:DUF4355 domain-containing protein n=1 Tax=Dysosmobacter acutus TaxID=2841504 RepID=A0ABS6FB15_9FIRM|nr:hypothetical protein [Dysosmobacter acutus]MBU5626545.1 hypothetical protein [Dysosmobacter acutus]
MEEILNTTAEEEAGIETNDAEFSAGWGEEESPAAYGPDAPETTGEAAEIAPENGDAPEDAGGAQQKAGHGESEQSEAKQTEEKAAQDIAFKVKYMDEEKTVSAEEAPALIQKGMDYDRIRVKYDEAKPVIEFMSRYAREAGVSLSEYVDHLRIEEKKAAGMPEEDARRAVELDNREERLRQEEASSAKAAEQTAASIAAAEKQRADIEAFAREYPDVNPTEIPREVWDKVRSGESLLGAYTRYENETLKVALAAASKARENAVRSTGSLKSAGSDNTNRDPFDEGWED